MDTTLSGVLSASEYQLVDLSLRMLQELADRSSALLSVRTARVRLVAVCAAHGCWHSMRRAQDGCDAVAQKLMHKLRFGLDRFDATSYVMSEDEFDAFSAHDPFAVDTAEALRSCLVPFAEVRGLQRGRQRGALTARLCAAVPEPGIAGRPRASAGSDGGRASRADGPVEEVQHGTLALSRPGGAPRGG